VFFRLAAAGIMPRYIPKDRADYNRVYKELQEAYELAVTHGYAKDYGTWDEYRTARLAPVGGGKGRGRKPASSEPTKAAIYQRKYRRAKRTYHASPELQAQHTWDSYWATVTKQPGSHP
jgi:hypothetical protein